MYYDLFLEQFFILIKTKIKQGVHSESIEDKAANEL